MDVSDLASYVTRMDGQGDYTKRASSSSSVRRLYSLDDGRNDPEVNVNVN